MLENNYWYKTLRIILYALLLTPLWVWSIFLFPFITTKILYFRLLVELALLIYVPLAIRYPEIRPRWSWLNRMVWIYLGIITLASIFGLDFNKSFWGTIERGEGLITILHFVIYFTILSAVFRSRREWMNYLLSAVSMIGFVAVYSLFQLHCSDNLSASRGSICDLFLPTPGIRIAGTIGNPSFFGAFIMFGLFLSFYLLIVQRRQKIAFSYWGIAATSFFIVLFLSIDAVSRQVLFFRAFIIYLLLALPIFFFLFRFQWWALISLSIVELYVLYSTQTRGALLALVAVLGLYFLFNIFRGRSFKIKLAFILLFLLLFGGSTLIYFNRDSPWVKSHNTLYRLATISPKDITTQSRLDTWQASFRGFKDRFLTGYGYENYNIAFNKYFPARIFKDQGSQIWFDRAHDIIFDILVTSGIFGLAAYLGIFLAAFLILYKLYRSPPDSFSPQSGLILALLLLAYFLQNLFVFDTQATYLLIFIVLGHIAFLERIRAPITKPEEKGYQVGFLLPAILTVLIFVAAYFVNLKPAFANYYTTRGIWAAKLKHYRDVQGAFARSLSLGTYMDQEIRQRLVDYALEAIASGQLSSQEQKDLYQYVISELRKSLKESPNDVKNYLYLMTVFNRFTPSSESLNEIFELGERALVLSPTRPQIYFELGQASFYKKDIQSGLNYFRKAIELNPEPKESQFNYLMAGIIAGREDIVAEQKKVITDLGYSFDYNDYVMMARAYLQAGDKMKVIESYKEALKLNDKNPDLYAKLAAIYGEVCDIENARIQVSKAIELNQSYAVDGYQFLRDLEVKCKK